MDLLLINPPWHKKSGNIWKSVSSCFPPFGLAILASLAREKGFSISILDCNALQIGLDDINNYLSFSSLKFVGITASTILIENAREVAKIIRKKYPEVKIIIGGVHATVKPEEVMGFEEFDYIVMGEGEKSFLELISGKNPFEIKGIGFKKEGKIIINQKQEIISDLDVYPFLAYDLLPMDKYYPALGTYKRKPSFFMITSRGCPGRCTFCKGNFLGEKIRFKSAKKIIDEIMFLQKNYGIKDITFYDDTFTTNRMRVKEICSLILQNEIDLTWCCFSRVDTVDLELLKEMQKAGCYQVMYGVESGDEEILKNLNKKIDFKKVEETVLATKKAGMEVRLAFMIGNPGDTEETIKKTIKYAIFLDPDLVTFNIATPYPGTEMFDWAEKNNCLIHKNWTEYDLSKPVMNLPTVSSEKVIEYYKKAYRQFYLRPGYILKRMIKIRSWEDFKRNLIPFMSFINFIFENGK
jgi:anaerobic magnesium-protoporphyrin IX monomethyl ester cyclase